MGHYLSVQFREHFCCPAAADGEVDWGAAIRPLDFTGFTGVLLDGSGIFTCKYSSHRYLAEWIEQADAKLDRNEHVEKHWNGKKRKTRRYRFANGVPIRDGEDALRVNWMELMILDPDGK